MYDDSYSVSLCHLASLFKISKFRAHSTFSDLIRIPISRMSDIVFYLDRSNNMEVFGFDLKDIVYILNRLV